MQEVIDYNFLIIGRSGSGKSATSKLLTGDPSITVANSLNQVTKQVKFYTGITHSISCRQVRFGILDIPGLDRIDNRFVLRQIVLQQLEKLNIVLHGVIYIASLTERDTVDQTKLFNFLDQLPWQTQTKKSCVIPILTKYDNFVIDSPQQDIQRTKQQFHKLFQSRGYSSAWSKRIYWVNFTKSLQFKIKMNEDIRQKYEGQLQRLQQMSRKNRKYTLNAEQIKKYILLQQKYVMENLLAKLTNNQIPFTLIPKSYRVPLHIKIQPSKVTESLTAVSASSIGLFIARVFKNDIPFPISLVMMGIPITLTFVNFITSCGQHTAEKMEAREDVGCRVISNFGKICQKINEQLEQQWKLLNKDIQFSVDGKYLRCQLNKNRCYKFFSLQRIQIREQSNEVCFSQEFSKKNENVSTFMMPIPAVAADGTWDPLINFKYEIKVFEQSTIMNIIQSLRGSFSHI